ncbi:MAG: hypothetical protein A2Y60_03850 [Chloroflexi bacterium RBG_13_54_9]|nr:MAG: hypothetical protein A2Y60_03850 [Chloroflexi bacterium RBG_13_54_9]
MSEDRASIIQEIVAFAEKLYDVATPRMPEEWLTLDLTMPQVRILLLLHREGPTHMTVLASKSGVAMSTATSTVDHLVEKGLLVRDSDPQDRRLVVCRLSSRGQELAADLWKLGRLQVEKLLEPLTLEQLQTVKAAITDVMKLLGGASGIENENG